MSGSLPVIDLMMTPSKSDQAKAKENTVVQSPPNLKDFDHKSKQKMNAVQEEGHHPGKEGKSVASSKSTLTNRRTREDRRKMGDHVNDNGVTA